MKVLVLRSEGEWEGLFIDGNLIDEGHNLGGARPQIIYLLEKSEQYGFDSSDVSFKWIENEEDETYLSTAGCFPKKLEELIGDY